GGGLCGRCAVLLLSDCGSDVHEEGPGHDPPGHESRSNGRACGYPERNIDYWYLSAAFHRLGAEGGAAIFLLAWRINLWTPAGRSSRTCGRKWRTIPAWGLSCPAGLWQATRSAGAWIGGCAQARCWPW